MKNLPLLWALGAGLLLAGCESTVEDVRGRLTGDGPSTAQTFTASEPATYAAARAALTQMDFRFTHGGEKQGEVDGVSAVNPGDDPGSAHQYTLKAHLDPTLDGTGTTVTVQLTEIIEQDSENHQGLGTEAPLRDTALAQAFFHEIQQNLVLPPAK
jgi:hypothetical protein